MMENSGHCNFTEIPHLSPATSNPPHNGRGLGQVGQDQGPGQLMFRGLIEINPDTLYPHCSPDTSGQPPVSRRARIHHKTVITPHTHTHTLD